MSSPAMPPCPRCGTAAQGNFCATCGASLARSTCSGCQASLAPGAAFCHQCGRGVAPGAGAVTAPPTSRESPLAWMLAGLLCVIAIAGVVYAMRDRRPDPVGSMANSGNTNPLLSQPAPDISGMTPKEQFARLNDRVMDAAQRRDSTTVFTFWPMALGAYQNLDPSDRDIDTRYHMATLYLMLTQYPEVLALADTILVESPNNLFGYYLQGMVATFQGDSAAARTAQARFREHYQTEIVKQQTEYLDHRPLLDQYFRQGGDQ